jgi:hypothetical protein
LLHHQSLLQAISAQLQIHLYCPWLSNHKPSANRLQQLRIEIIKFRQRPMEINWLSPQVNRHLIFAH